VRGGEGRLELAALERRIAAAQESKFAGAYLVVAGSPQLDALRVAAEDMRDKKNQSGFLNRTEQHHLDKAQFGLAAAERHLITHAGAEPAGRDGRGMHVVCTLYPPVPREIPLGARVCVQRWDYKVRAHSLDMPSLSEGASLKRSLLSEGESLKRSLLSEGASLKRSLLSEGESPKRRLLSTTCGMHRTD